MKEYIAEYIVPVVPADEKGKNLKFDFINAKRLIQCKDCKHQVLALRKAGWHMAAIRYELGNRFTAKQIIDAVNEYDRRHRDVQKAN